MAENATLEQLATGEVLRALRKEKDLTLAEVGSSIGVGASHLSLVERGKIGISLPTLFGLLQTLEIGKADFMARVEEVIVRLQAEKKKRRDIQSFHKEIGENLRQIEKEAKKTGNTMILNLCLRIRGIFPDWLSAENIDSYIQEEISDHPPSFSPNTNET